MFSRYVDFYISILSETLSVSLLKYSYILIY